MMNSQAHRSSRALRDPKLAETDFIDYLDTSRIIHSTVPCALTHLGSLHVRDVCIQAATVQPSSNRLDLGEDAAAW